MKEDTRAALVGAATELFARHGLDGPSLDDIAAAAGKTRGAFYVHFDDRDALLTAVMAETGEKTLDQFLGPREAPLDLAAVLTGFVAKIGAGRYVLGPGGGVKPHQLMDACARSREIRDRYAAIVSDTLTRLSGAVRTAQQSDQVRRDVAAVDVAALLFAAVLGIQTMLELELPLDVPGAGAAALTLLNPELGPGPSPVSRSRGRSSSRRAPAAAAGPRRGGPRR
jgi:AcrR family transcriptional regulator